MELAFKCRDFSFAQVSGNFYHTKLKFLNREYLPRYSLSTFVFLNLTDEL